MVEQTHFDNFKIQIIAKTIINRPLTKATVGDTNMHYKSVLFELEAITYTKLSINLSISKVIAHHCY